MRNLIVKFLLIYTVSSSVYALSEAEFIQTLLTNHAFFEKERINLTIKEIEMEGDRSNYEDWDWTIGAEIGRISKNKIKNDYTSSTDYAQSTLQSVREISTDLSRKFLSNGSELSISFDKSLPVKDEALYDKNGYQKDKNTTEYLDDMTLSWHLPLMKNKAGIVDQKTYDLAVLDFKDERLVLAESQEDFLEEKLMIFLDWVNYQSQINIVKANIAQAESIVKRIQNAKTKIASSTLTMRRSIDKSKRLLLDLQSKLKAEQKRLNILLPSIDLSKNPLTLEWDTRVQFVPNLNQHISSQVRDIQRIKIEQLKNTRSIQTYQNSQLPDLDFTLSATREEARGNYASYSTSAEVEYEAKLEFSYPLTGDVSNQVYLKKYRLKNRQLELKLKDKFDDVLSDAQKLTTELKQGLRKINLYKQQLKQINETNIEVELEAFLQGNGNIRFVISEQDDYQELLLDQLNALIEYHKNRILYQSLLDQLLRIS